MCEKAANPACACRESASQSLFLHTPTKYIVRFALSLGMKSANGMSSGHLYLAHTKRDHSHAAYAHGVCGAILGISCAPESEFFYNRFGVRSALKAFKNALGHNEQTANFKSLMTRTILTK